MKQRKRAKEWFEDEEFWRATYPFMFPETRFSETEELIENILTLTSPSGKSALDLCCGPGRCSIALARRGFSVTGVDRTKYLLGKARARAKKERLSVEWIEKDMRDFVRQDAYDLAISTFTSFGYFANRSEDVLVLSNIFTSLRRNGSFFIDLMGKEVLARRFQPASADELPNGSMLVERRQILDNWSRIRNDWMVVHNGRARQYTLQLNLYSGQELLERMEHVGFVDLKLYGSLDGEPYGPAAGRLIAVGRKP